MKRKFCCSLFLSFLICGCSQSRAPDYQYIFTQTLTQPTLTMTPTSVMELWTLTPTTSLTPTTQSTTTIPQPTLSAENTKTLIFSLLKDNGGCRLPCLWNLTPGKSDLQKLDDFMSQFGDLVSTDVYVHVSEFGKNGGVFISYRENNVHISIDFSYYKKEQTGLEILVLNGYSMNEQGKDLDWMSSDVSPLYGNASFNKAFEYYMLPQLLSKYGIPENVLLAPFPDDPSRPDIKWHPFSLVLFYPEQGILIEYVSPRETSGSDFVGCPSKSHIRISVWSSDDNLTLQYIVQKAGGLINEFNIDYFKPVEEATSMSMDEFYQIFINPKNTSCINTPIELWVEP